MAFVPGVVFAMMLIPAGVGAGEGTAAPTTAPPSDARAERSADTAKEEKPDRTRTPRTTGAKPQEKPAAKPAAPAVVKPAVLHFADNGAWADAKVKVLNAKKIYYGKADTATAPATVKAKKVFAKIPEYQEIVRRGLTKDDIEYWTLMKKASKKFRAAVKKAAGTEGKDLVAEEGAIEVKGETIPDMTDAVIKALGT
ncbi:MAG: hypothetical protein ACYTGX_07975 [Planctomycetota bacterium]|jgi:hypothetical protein